MNELAEKKAELASLCLKMTPEQLADFYTASLELNIFSEEMKYRFAEKVLQGKTGWMDNQIYIPDVIFDKVHLIDQGTDRENTAIDIANWAFVHWFNRNKALSKPEDNLISLEEIQKHIDKLILGTPTGDKRNTLTQINTFLIGLVGIREDYLRGTQVFYDDPKAINPGTYYFVEKTSTGKALLSQSPEEHGATIEVDFKYLIKR